MKESEEKSRKKATSILKDPGRLRKLVVSVSQKTATLSKTPKVAEISAKIQPLLRMVKAYAAGEYRNVPWQTILLVVTALVYFVSPIDAIADVVPLLGFGDDLALLTAVIASISHDIEAFLDWEKAKVENAQTTDYTESRSGNGDDMQKA